MGSSQRDASSAPLLALVDEALGAVLSAERVEAVRREALRLAGLDALPVDPAQLRAFVDGALFEVLVQHLAMSDCVEVLDQLRRTLQHVQGQQFESDVRRRGRGSWHVRVVLVVTDKPGLGPHLAEHMPAEVEVVTVAGELELDARLAALEGASLVVLDWRAPFLEAALARLDRLPPDSAILGWGAPAEEQERMQDRLPKAMLLVRTDPDASLEELTQLGRRIARL